MPPCGMAKAFRGAALFHKTGRPGLFTKTARTPCVRRRPFSAPDRQGRISAGLRRFRNLVPKIFLLLGLGISFACALGIGEFKAVVHVFFPPPAHQVQDGFQGTPFFGDGIFHPGRDLGVHGAADQAVGFQFPQLVGQRPLGYLGDLAHQFAETLGAVADQALQNQRFALASDHFQGDFHLTSNLYFFHKILSK